VSAPTLNRAMTEDQLSQAIIEAAIYRGWRVHHIRRSDRAIQQGHSGFPDLCLARNGRVLFMELKSEKGRSSPDQDAWFDALSDLDGPAVMFIIRPSRLDFVLGLLE